MLAQARDYDTYMKGIVPPLGFDAVHEQVLLSDKPEEAAENLRA
jgi:hypothetical protein